MHVPQKKKTFATETGISEIKRAKAGVSRCISSTSTRTPLNLFGLAHAQSYVQVPSSAAGDIPGRSMITGFGTVQARG